MRHTFIVAEMSANHCGDIKLAKEIIRTAKEIGADACKMQTYTADTLTIDCDRPEFRIDGGLWAGMTLYELYQKASTPWEWQGELMDYAKSIGMILFSTPFDRTAVDFLEGIGNPIYKIASFEAYDYPLIRYAAQRHKPMIISVGLSTLGEIERAVMACKEAGNDDITILKCTSEYPAPPEDMNLLTITDLIRRLSPLGVKVGLSDHSLSNEGVVAAVALGAMVIEKHFTIDRGLGGPDSGFSLDREGFASMVKSVRLAERMMGKVDYAPKAGRAGARSLYVVRDVQRGDLVTDENVRSIRPGIGLPPGELDGVLGHRFARDVHFGTPLSWDLME